MICFRAREGVPFFFFLVMVAVLFARKDTPVEMAKWLIDSLTLLEG